MANTASSLPALLVIAGPTASGKTDLSIRLAQYYGTEIISADSRQCYRELTIGTAKPTNSELALVPHHFINSHSIKENFSAGKFALEAEKTLSSLFTRHDIVIVTGGTGLYIKALTEGLDEFPEIDPTVRISLNATVKREGVAPLVALIQEKDPAYFEKADLNNTARLIRAAEVILSTGKPFSLFHLKKDKKLPFNLVAVSIDWPRNILYERINNRVEKMMKDGLVAEVQGLVDYQANPALQTVGYTEIFDLLKGKLAYQEAVDKIKQHSRNYAKRQLTWFRNQGNYRFLGYTEAEHFLRSPHLWK